jgi:DNA-binding response OmpR family regulator
MAERILLVDDDPDFCEVVSRQLTAAGYSVHSVSSAREADLQMRSDPPALAIVDGFLSDRDGESWIAAQRRAGKRALHVFFVSGFATYARDFYTRQRLVRDLGVLHVLPKPIEAKDLQRYVDAALSPDRKSVGGIDEVALARLRRAYGSELAQKVAVISSSISLAKSTRSHEPLLEARRSAHSLQGTAGSYGFTAVGQAAGRVSELLEHDMPRWDAIEASLADLRARVEFAASSI